MAIVAFFALIVVAIFLLLKPRENTTFTKSEMDAFRHAEQVKKDLGDVQKLVGPAKPDASLSIGAFLPKPPPPPEPPKKD